MPAQKRPLPSPSSKPSDHVEANGTAGASSTGGGGGGLHLAPGGGAANRVVDSQPQRVADSGSAKRGGGAYSDSESSESDADMDEFILVKLAEIRKEVQCPICLGIIRKTRTVMECLHRFCRDCIDKSMRLGNNECPACRTHCASRRSLRDDPNYDALIATLYPDIDKYEEEEFAFSEEEKTRNKKIQATIEETVRKQSEAMGKKRSTAKATANAFARKYRRNIRTRGRGRSVARDIVVTVSDDEDREEVNANDASKESSSADNHSPDLKQKRGKKRPAPVPSPARTIGSSDHGFEENGELVSVEENFNTSPDLKQKRGKKRPAPVPSPARTIGSSDHGFEENDELVSVKENFTTSPDLKQKRGKKRPAPSPARTIGSSDHGFEETDELVSVKENFTTSSDLKQKRGKKRPAPVPSPARTIDSTDHGFEENDEPVSVKENFTTAPLRGEMLAWGKNGARSQTRYGNVGGLSGRLGKGGRVAKLVEHLRTTDGMDKEFNLYLVLLPLDEQTMPKLEKPYLSCQPTASIRHLVQLIALKLSRQVEELEIYVRMDLHSRGVATDSSSAKTKVRLFDGLERLREDKLLSDLHPSFASGHNDLELLYALKTQD